MILVVERRPTQRTVLRLLQGPDEDAAGKERTTHLMFGKKKHSQELDPPPIARQSPEAVEVLRVWAEPGSPQQLTVRTIWKDPGAWGLLLVDVARHVALAYEREGQSSAGVLQRIRELFDAEWDAPTDGPQDLSGEKRP